MGFYPISCTKAKDVFRAKFGAFREDFIAHLKILSDKTERFSPQAFKILKLVEAKATKDDFIKEAHFNKICKAHSIAMAGPGGRDSLLDILDKLGIVMHFEKLPFLTNYLLNPRWLTYGIYSLMYSDAAREAKGRLSEADLVSILKRANTSISNGRAFKYGPDRCRIVADAMIAFRVAYRLRDGQLVIPALLAPMQPEHDFKADGAIAFRFDFSSFLPRHVLPSLIVDHYKDIARYKENDVVWQSGVLLRPRHREAEAFVRADYNSRTLDFFVKGAEAPSYLGSLRDSVLCILETTPQLAFEEKVELRSDMRVEVQGPAGAGKPVWVPFQIIRTAWLNRLERIPGPDGFLYDTNRVLASMPVQAHQKQADVFISYSSKDGAGVEALAEEIEKNHISVWYDRGLIGGQPFREVLQARIETTKAVVVVWTENSVDSKWVRAEASLADEQNKLIGLKHPGIDVRRIPMPFREAHIIELGKFADLYKALKLKGVVPRI